MYTLTMYDHNGTDPSGTYDDFNSVATALSAAMPATVISQPDSSREEWVVYPSQAELDYDLRYSYPGQCIGWIRCAGLKPLRAPVGPQIGTLEQHNPDGTVTVSTFSWPGAPTLWVIDDKDTWDEVYLWWGSAPDPDCGFVLAPAPPEMVALVEIAEAEDGFHQPVESDDGILRRLAFEYLA